MSVSRETAAGLAMGVVLGATATYFLGRFARDPGHMQHEGRRVDLTPDDKVRTVEPPEGTTEPPDVDEEKRDTLGPMPSIQTATTRPAKSRPAASRRLSVLSRHASMMEEPDDAGEAASDAREPDSILSELRILSEKAKTHGEITLDADKFAMLTSKVKNTMQTTASHENLAMQRRKSVAHKISQSSSVPTGFHEDVKACVHRRGRRGPSSRGMVRWPTMLAFSPVMPL